MDRSMKDPATASSRIYIGNLGENVSKSDIENIFRKYGIIRGVMLSRNFGFVQYDSDDSANNAIANENEKKYFNRKIIVRNAMKGNNNDKNIGGSSQNNQGTINNNLGGNNSSANNMSVGGNKGSQIQDSNLRGARPQWRNNRNIRNTDTNMNMQNGRDRSPLDGGRPFNNADRWGGADQGNDRPNHNFRQNTLAQNDLGGPIQNIGNNAGFGGSGNVPRVGMGVLVNENLTENTSRAKVGGIAMPSTLPENRTAQSIRAKYPDANDCEIIVVAKNLTEYAETVEARLKRLGLQVDLLFPNPDVPVGKVLANIASRGCLYAIVIAADNLEMRSVTLNVLYGQPAEHRNMPLDDAIEFIFNNFQKLMRGEKVAGDLDDQQSQLVTIPLSSTRHPDTLQHLINILAENRTLTVLQYDALSKYLNERRDAQYKLELGDSSETSTAAELISHSVNTPTPLSEPDKEKELQKRIMDILNKPSITTINTESPLAKESQPTGVSEQRKVLLPAKPDGSHDRQEPQLLNDPKVQKALDSLFNF